MSSSPAALRRGPARRHLLTALLTVLTVPLLTVLPASMATAAPDTVTAGSEIEDFSPYQGQTVCEPVARPGVVAFRDLVLEAYPATADSGIVRDCSIGGLSEHKEGRAWDWRVNTANPDEVAFADDLMAWLLATDEHGNEAAMARRLGVMYMIWDARIWKSYQAAKGWQPYSGASPHTDHVHLSFSWAGALGETSYWTGRVAPVMERPVPPPATEPETESDTATSTIEIAPEPAPVLDRRTQLELRRTAVRSLPGPWRRR